MPLPMMTRRGALDFALLERSLHIMKVLPCGQKLKTWPSLAYIGYHAIAVPVPPVFVKNIEIDGTGRSRYRRDPVQGGVLGRRRREVRRDARRRPSRCIAQRQCMDAPVRTSKVRRPWHALSSSTRRRKTGILEGGKTAPRGTDSPLRLNSIAVPSHRYTDSFRSARMKSWITAVAL